jgi:hypothetical protein
MPGATSCALVASPAAAKILNGAAKPHGLMTAPRGAEQERVCSAVKQGV